MNKISKIVVPTLAIAMGAALVGSVSSTLAWYQYSTKAQAAYIGTSVGNSENLEIRVKDGAPVNNQQNYKWVSNAKSADIAQLVSEGYGTNVIPVTPATLASYDGTADALPTITNNNVVDKFYSGVETGVAGYGKAATDANYVQFKLNVRYKKTGDAVSYEEKALKLVDLTIVSDNATVDNDLWKAVRVQISSSHKTGEQQKIDPQTNEPMVDGNNDPIMEDVFDNYNSLLARDSQTKIAPITDNTDPEYAANQAQKYVLTDTSANLDTDNNGELDQAWKYEWEDNSAVVYGGATGSQQKAINAAYGDLDQKVAVIPADAENGVELTVTIWIEGWQKLEHFPNGNKNDTLWSSVTGVITGEEEPSAHNFGSIALTEGVLYLDSTTNKLYSRTASETWEEVTVATVAGVNPDAAHATGNVGDYYIYTNGDQRTLYRFNGGSYSSAMWDPTTYVNTQFKVGLRFAAEENA